MALNKNQQLLLDLMVRAEKLMRENDIKFFLFGGSTIGALRHNGFIPWDDDIDIIIDAENFYKLQKLFENGPIDDMDLVYFHNDPYWYRAYAMIVNLTDTCYTRPCLYTTGRNAGTRIDTMICDYIPHERLEEYKHELMLYQEILTDSVRIDDNIFYIKDEYYALRERMEQVGKTVLEKELRKSLESYATPDADELVVRYSTRAIRHYAIDTLYEPLYHDFEGYMMPIPAKPEKQLRQQYGYDWYMIPEAEEYKIHRFFHNYDISGNNYHEDLKNFYDRDELQAAARLHKAEQIDRLGNDLENTRIRADLLTQREFVRADIEGREEYFAELEKGKKYGEIYSRLENLIKNIASISQVRREYKSLPESIMKCWLDACVYYGKYFKAIKLIRAFEIGDDAGFKDEIGMVDKVAALAEAYQDRNTDLMMERRKGFSESEAALIPECIFTDAVLRKKDCNDYTAGDLIKRCREYLELMPGNYEIKKVLADLLYETGAIEEAMELYREVHSNTTNGLDVLDIETRFDFEPRYSSNEIEDEIDRILRDIL